LNWRNTHHEQLAGFMGKVQVLNEGTVDRCPILDHVLADRNLDYTIVRNEC
jgi:hypothetical protein